MHGRQGARRTARCRNELDHGGALVLRPDRDETSVRRPGSGERRLNGVMGKSVRILCADGLNVQVITGAVVFAVPPKGDLTAVRGECRADLRTGERGKGCLLYVG